MGDYGAKVSQSGFDIAQALSNQLAMSSSFNSYKISSQGANSATIAAPPGSTASVAIVHGLGYAPSFLIFYRADNGEWAIANSLSFTINGSNMGTTGVWSDTSSVNIGFYNNTGAQYICNYYYFIFEDTAT